MRKIIIFVLTVCILLFSGCSCNQKQVLNFDTTWLDPNSSFDRKYSVSLEDYSDGDVAFLGKSKDKYGDIELYGTYNVRFTNCRQSELTGLVDDAFISTLRNDTLYKIETNLDVNVKFKVVSEEEYHDTITATAYFFGKSLFPIYSNTITNAHYVGINNDTAKIYAVSNLVDTIVYNGDSYTVTRKGSSSDATIDQSDKYSYQQGTVIDNAMLLFAIENYNIENSSSKTLSVISPSYGDDQTLAVQCFEVASKFTVNDTEYTDVKKEAFIIQPENSGCLGGNTGMSQIVYLTGNKIIRYVSPLVSYDSNYACLGALVFDLEND